MSDRLVPPDNPTLPKGDIVYIAKKVDTPAPSEDEAGEEPNAAPDPSLSFDDCKILDWLDEHKPVTDEDGHAIGVLAQKLGMDKYDVGRRVTRLYRLKPPMVDKVIRGKRTYEVRRPHQSSELPPDWEVTWAVPKAATAATLRTQARLQADNQLTPDEEDQRVLNALAKFGPAMDLKSHMRGMLARRTGLDPERVSASLERLDFAEKIHREMVDLRGYTRCVEVRLIEQASILPSNWHELVGDSPLLKPAASPPSEKLLELVRYVLANPVGSQSGKAVELLASKFDMPADHLKRFLSGAWAPYFEMLPNPKGPGVRGIRCSPAARKLISDNSPVRP